MDGVRQTRVCAEDDDAASTSASARTTARPSRSSRRGGQRTGRLTSIEESGHVWVQVVDGDRAYALRCMAMAAFEDDDLHSEVLVWEHSCGIGVVIGRGLESDPTGLRHTRESFVHTMEVQPHELQEVDARGVESPDTSAVALARTAAQ